MGAGGAADPSAQAALERGMRPEEEAGFVRASLSIPPAPGVAVSGGSFLPAHRASAGPSGLVGARGLAAVKFPLRACSSKNGGYCSPGGLQPPLCSSERFNFFFPE